MASMDDRLGASEFLTVNTYLMHFLSRRLSIFVFACCDASHTALRLFAVRIGCGCRKDGYIDWAFAWAFEVL